MMASQPTGKALRPLSLVTGCSLDMSALDNENFADGGNSAVKTSGEDGKSARAIKLDVSLFT